MYILYLITSGCRWKMYDPSTPLGSCFQFSSLSCFSHPWLNKTNAHAICSSFGYRYYSTRCWLVRHRLLTTNRWNKILRIHSGYDLSSGAVCRFCDSFLDSDHDDRWWCLWNLHDDFSFYHAGIKNVVANISDWHPFKNQKTNMHICVYLLDMSDPNTTAAAHPTCQTLHGSLPFQTKHRDNHPRQKGPNSVEENICEQKLQDFKPGPQWEFHTVVKEGPDRGDLTRSLYKNLLKASLANFHTSTF